MSCPINKHANARAIFSLSKAAAPVLCPWRLHIGYAYLLDTTLVAARKKKTGERKSKLPDDGFDSVVAGPIPLSEATEFAAPQVRITIEGRLMPE